MTINGPPSRALTEGPVTCWVLRALCRRLDLTLRLHPIDMFDEARDCLASYRDQHGTHPLLILDDAEGMTAQALDLLRRLTAIDLDADDRFSVLLASTERLLKTLRGPNMEPLRTRFAYVQALRPFDIEDTRNYVRFHLRQVNVAEDLFSDSAITTIFNASQGVPRAVNQIALQALINAAVQGIDKIDGKDMKRVLHAHPLYTA